MCPLIPVTRTWKVLRRPTKFSTLAVVGHEPHLSRLLSFILTGRSQCLFDIKKGGFAILEFEDEFDICKARLKCLVQPQLSKKMK
jgi:phosphohistidine phosphatase SixA